MSKTQVLIDRLTGAGFSEPCVRAVLPTWFEQEETPSSQMLLRLMLARRLNLDPETLMDDDVPLSFLSSGPVKFKHMRLGPGARRDALTSFAIGTSRILFTGVEEGSPEIWPSAAEMRQSIMSSGRDCVGFGDVLVLCWSLGVPVLHLRVFPGQTKGITAMAVRLGSRHAILVARESGVPAQYMFHIAHELGHIALGHLKNTTAIIDADSEDPANANDALINDEEEHQADCFAQVLLTGVENFNVSRMLTATSAAGTAKELANHAVRVGADLKIDPGHVLMSFGNATKEWPLAMAAARQIPDQDATPSSLVNKVLWSQLSVTSDEQSFSFLKAVAAV